MNDDQRACYAAFKAKDVRFDGRFFVGVASTGIYCRPVCLARLPKPENCSFHPSAAAAEQAGFRPCLLCRPELAPGNAPLDAAASLAQRAARLLEDHCASEHRVDELARRLGCSDRHLRRVFAAAYHVTPIQYLQTCRLLLAKQLLTDSALPVIDVAMAAGFGSLRRFNALFARQYRMAPSALRRQAGPSGAAADAVTLALGYRPPYRWEAQLAFLAARAIPGVEQVADGEYRRAVCLPDAAGKPLSGWLRVGHRPEKRVLTVAVDAALLPVLPRVLARVRHLFDLGCDPDAVYETLAPINALRPGAVVLGTRLPGCFDPFEMAVRAVLGQQITVKAAATLATRLVAAHGIPVVTGIAGLSHVFPSPQGIVALGDGVGDALGGLGITGARARTIQALARLFADGAIDWDGGAEPAAVVETLQRVPGIGPWTAQYIALRALGWPDAFPHADYGLGQALAPRTPREILALAEAWRPWRGYATINLWHSLAA
ncbi:DNA-3-methyladenine glycosylase 2 family protein [Azonexus sp. R2A61]|uniref:DNA-3-methyladenine glycosylase 2 family protein n=1 Tax=Azonexus sp. R2A61 TaxID=2744443 RepID=UPI001F402CA8|nr:DNA-3-methyladenine glycosylase 2 [Azonexus sp. R2A61]